MIKIDQSISIIEPYFDGGDSYTNHNKYSYILQYAVEGNLEVSQNWDSGVIKLSAEGEGFLERKINAEDVSGFDMLNVKACCPKSVRMKIYLDDVLIMDEFGINVLENYKAELKSDKVEKIRFHFINNSDASSTVNLYYLGVSRNEKVEVLYSGSWEGCIEDEISFVPYDDDVFPNKDADCFKSFDDKKLKYTYLEEKRIAEEALKIEPEQFISKTTAFGYRKENPFADKAEALAFIGMSEKNPDMIKMACRYALSVAACTYWCADSMEEIPTATWHHRSFEEASMCSLVSMVISICGNSLTWHGRNILYQAIIMKGLPRIEADFMTMEYIYKMNQGLAFMSGYIRALVCLSHQYPRYEARIFEAEKIMAEMLDNAQNSDGSTDEGAGYWQYTFWSALKSIVIFAKHRGMTLKAYIGDRFKSTSDFGLFLLDKSGKMLPYNDCKAGYYIPFMCKCFYMLTGDERWATVYNKSDVLSLGIDNILYNEKIPNVNAEILKECEEFKGVGLLSVCRGNMRIFCVSGKSNATHCHADKGSFMLYSADKPLLCDAGGGVYGTADSAMSYETRLHNAAMPMSSGKPMCQKKGAEVKGEYSYEYKNGILSWRSDQTSAWDSSVVKKNVREIYSEDEREYVITDVFEFSEPMNVAVNFCIADKESVEILPCGEYSSIEYLGDEKMSRMMIISNKAEKVKMVTRVKVVSR